MIEPTRTSALAHPARTADPRPTPSFADAGTVEAPEEPVHPTKTFTGPAQLAPKPEGLPGYEILGELGRGGMGVVYKARHLGLNRVCALKMILAGGHAGEAHLARFQTEAEAVARLQHPHIVAVYDVGRHDGRPFLSLEYCPGGSLDRKLGGTPLPPAAAAALVRSLAEAMQTAHDARVIHRDLKPSNVLIAADGAAKVSDFGLAKFLDDAGQTHTGAVLGTPSYMAPEQAHGAKDVGPRTDVYALGAILYDCLTGRPPFKAATGMDTLRLVVGQEPVPPTHLNATVPRDLETIVLKCLQKESSRRYGSAGELAADLGRYLAAEPILARPVGVVGRTWRWGRRNPRMAGMAATVALLLVAVATVTSVLSYRLSVRRAEAEENAGLAGENARQADMARAAAEEEQRKAEKARDTTAQQRKLALDTVRDILLRVDDLMKNDITLAPLRAEIIRRMLSDVDQIRDHAKKNPLEDRTEAIAYSRMGDLYFRTNRIQDSHEWYVKAHAILKGQAEDTSEDPNALRNQAAAATNLAEAEWRLGRGKRARELHSEALRLRERRVKLLAGTNAEEIERAAAAMDEAESLTNVAYADLRLGEPVSAIKHYQRADAAYIGLGPPLAQTLRVRRIRAEIEVRVADARARLGELDKAHQHFLKALEDRMELARMVVRPVATASLIRTDIGQSHMYNGDFLLFHKKDARAAGDLYTLCLEGFERELKDDPKSIDLRQRIAASHYRLGIVSGARPELALLTGAAADLAPRGKHYAESLRLREELAKIDPNDAQSGVELLLSQARLRKVDDARRTADRLLRQAGTDRQVLFQTACGYGILADGDDEVAGKFRDEAIRVMKTLVEQGWKDQGGLETDPDLTALKNDKRFADLIARLRAVGDEAN